MSKDKWVRRFSVDETARHKNGFTIYKITSVLFPIHSPETITVISVWKRYSDIQKLHLSMKSLHAGLHLRGAFPLLPKYSYFKRFQQAVIEERAKAIKSLLEFVAEHKLLFTSTEFVNFLQTGYSEPESSSIGVINAIRSSLHLPIEETPPLEYQTSDDDSRSPQHSVIQPATPAAGPDFIAQIPIHAGRDAERRPSPRPARAGSFQSISSIDSIDSDLYSELDKVSIQNTTPMVKKNVLPDLITFDTPSTSRFDDYHTMRSDDTISLSSTNQRSEYSASIASNTRRSDPANHIQDSYTRSNSRVSCTSVLSLSNISSTDWKTKTEDSYVFEAGYMLNLAARYEDMKEYSRAFDCYKAGIEKMLVGVQMDSDQQRRALIKEKTNKYLSYAEAIYTSHLSGAEQSLLPPRPAPRLHCPIPLSMLRRPYEELVSYRVLAVLGDRMMLVLHRGHQTCYAMKVIKKIPYNLTEFDEYFLQNTKETREPILPTVIPYMVPLHAYIETNNLIFLILAYAPGEKLFDYIKNYAKSLPHTPAREVNLENVFTEPKNKISDGDNATEIQIEKVDDGSKNKTKPIHDVSEKRMKNLNAIETKIEETNSDASTNEIKQIYDVSENKTKSTDDVPEIGIKKLDDISDIKIKDLDIQNKNLNIKSIIKLETDINKDSEISIIDRLEMNDASNNNKTENTDNMDTTQLLKNSQNLLNNVDKVLSEALDKVIETVIVDESVKVGKVEVVEGSADETKVQSLDKVEKRVETSRIDRPAAGEAGAGGAGGVLPPATVASWGAQILVALESLHNCGVVCRDLNPSNILLGDGGQVLLTYFTSYGDAQCALSSLHARRARRCLHVAPELYTYTYFEEKDDLLEKVCDFWSFGAIMYELLCGAPLSHFHSGAFTSHSLLPLPAGLPLEAQSLLTQLLTYEPSERLGGGKDGIDEIKRHPYFKHINWTEVYDSWNVPD